MQRSVSRHPRTHCHSGSHPQAHINTHPHIQTHHFTILICLELMKCYFSVCLSAISHGQQQTSHLSADSSTLTHHTASSQVSSAHSHNYLAALASTCFEFDTCLPTPTQPQVKSQQVIQTVNRPAVVQHNSTHSFRQNIRPHSHSHMQWRICE